MKTPLDKEERSQSNFSRVHGRFQDCFSRLRGMPNCGHCADARARKASATKWGWEWIMDFQPAVSIMSVAWLKTEALRAVRQFYKPKAQRRRAGKAEVLQKGSQILWNRLGMPVRVPTERSSNWQFGYRSIIRCGTKGTCSALLSTSQISARELCQINHLEIVQEKQ